MQAPVLSHQISHGNDSQILQQRNRKKHSLYASNASIVTRSVGYNVCCVTCTSYLHNVVLVGCLYSVSYNILTLQHLWLYNFEDEKYMSGKWCQMSLHYKFQEQSKKHVEKSGFDQKRVFLPVIYIDNSTLREHKLFGTWNIVGNWGFFRLFSNPAMASEKILLGKEPP